MELQSAGTPPGPEQPAKAIILGRLNVTDVTYLTFDGKSNYNSLQASVERRFSTIGFLAAYVGSFYR